MKELIITADSRGIVNMEEFRKFFRELKMGKHLVTVKDMRKRSLPQNAYYWGVVVPMVKRGLNDAGYDEVSNNEDAHEVLKHVHLRRRMVSKQTGEVIDIAGSSAKLNVSEFNDYIENICRWSAEYLGVVIPSPNEQMVEFNEWEEKQYEDVVEA